jgi:acyl dehydratase
MTSPQFPFPAIGTLHLANTITQHRPVAIGEVLQLEVHCSQPRAHPKGRAIDFVATATAGGDVVWESTSTYLRRGGADDAEVSAPSAAEGLAIVPGRATWSLAGDVGRRYAAVSGDHNPIHLYPLTARALGFRRQIAHGMWTLARCLAALENRLPDSVTVDAAFKRPVFLPGTVAFGQDAADDGIAFALTSPGSGSAHLVGRTHSPR